MSEITFKDLGLEPKIKYTEVKIGEDKILSVVNYLPIADKTNLITFVADLAIDVEHSSLHRSPDGIQQQTFRASEYA